MGIPSQEKNAKRLEVPSCKMRPGHKYKMTSRVHHQYTAMTSLDEHKLHSDPELVKSIPWRSSEHIRDIRCLIHRMYM